MLSAPDVEVYEVELNTNSYLPDYDASSTEWPLIIRCNSNKRDAREFEVRVFDVTSGYLGAGPQDLVGCLKATGVDFDEEEIYSSKRIQKKYHK